MNLFITNNALNSDVFCVNTNDGCLHIMENSFQTFCVIRSYKKTVKRHIITIEHHQKSENEGDFLIFTDNNEININVWCK